MDIITWLQDGADQIPEWIRWLVSAGFAALEVLGLGPFIPGEVAVLLLGAPFDDLLSALVLVLAVTVGASIGDHVLYFLGRRFGAGIRERKFVQRLGVERWDAAVAVVERRGPLAIIATRLVPIIRTLTPLAAGTAGVQQVRFTVASLVGSLTWALVWGGSGYLLQSSIAVAQRALGNVTWIIAAVIGAVVLVFVLVRWARRRDLIERVRERADGRTVAFWALVGVTGVAVVVALVTGAGPDWASAARRTVGLVTAAAATVAAVLAVPRRRQNGTDHTLTVARFALVAGTLVVAMVLHGLLGWLGVTLIALLGIVELSGRTSRFGTVAAALGGFGGGVFVWPWGWSDGFAVVGTLGSLAVFAAVLLGGVAVVRTWGDRFLRPEAA